MAGALAAHAEGLAALGDNPAALGLRGGASLRASSLQWLEGSSLQSGAMGFSPLPGRFGAAIQWIQFSSGDIAGFDETAQGDAIPLGNHFQTRETQIRLALASGFWTGETRRLELGFAVSAIHRDFDVQSDGQAALDLGLRYGNPQGGFRLSASVLSLGGRLAGDSLATRFQLAGRASLGHLAFRTLHLVARGDLPLVEGGRALGAVALEYPVGSFIAFRAGQHLNHSLAQWTLGAGLALGAGWGGIKVDFAWISMGSFGGRQVWTLGLDF